MNDIDNQIAIGLQIIYTPSATQLIVTISKHPSGLGNGPWKRGEMTPPDAKRHHSVAIEMHAVRKISFVDAPCMHDVKRKIMSHSPASTSVPHPHRQHGLSPLHVPRPQLPFGLKPLSKSPPPADNELLQPKLPPSSQTRNPARSPRDLSPTFLTERSRAYPPPCG